MLQNRRWIGLSFASSHGIHLALILAMSLDFPDPFLSEQPAGKWLVGGVAYLLIALMALTSTNAAQRWMGEALEATALDWLLLDLGRIRPHLREPCEERASEFLCTLSCLHPGSPADPLGWPHQTQNSVEPREWINTWVCLNQGSVKQPAKSH